MDNLIIIISILIGICLFVAYFYIMQHKHILNVKLNNNLKMLSSDNNRLMKYSNGSVRYNNRKTNEKDHDEHSYHSDDDSNHNDNDNIDHNRIFKKIDNSEYKLPINNKLYNDNNIDPRAGPICKQTLDCNSKKRYDLLINDDYDSFDTFNTNCTRDISSYSQETNNPKIDKMLLVENPAIYENISRQL